MDKYKKIQSLRKYVLTQKNKDIKELEKEGFEWVKISAKNKIAYEIDWLGIPVIQTPEDLIIMQELVFGIKPDFIVETGVAHGGSLIFYASLFELLGKGKVIGIDIDIRKHNREVLEKHPLFKRIKLIEASSVEEETKRKVMKMIPAKAKVMVCLDSNHTKPHVFQELKLYQDLVNKGSYFVVFDTITSKLADAGIADRKYINNGPMEAVREFIKENSNFEIDKKFNKLFTTYSPDGYLKRIR
jgi:cephalosporin hydroxylase